MRTWTSLAKKISRWKERLFTTDLPAPQVELLLAHARESGISNLLHLIDLIERQHGHAASAGAGKPIDAAGRPIPWFTYPALAYLDQFDLKEKSVFEYGAGHGSLYFAGRAKHVVSVEHDPVWHAKVAAQAPANLSVLLRSEKGNYVSAVTESARLWDVIVIDGAWRRDCVGAALSNLAPNGIIILDNSDWYPHTAGDLRSAGLLEVDFTGLGPVNYYIWTTSFFFRRDARPATTDTIQPRPGIGSMAQVVDAAISVKPDA